MAAYCANRKLVEQTRSGRGTSFQMMNKLIITWLL